MEFNEYNTSSIGGEASLGPNILFFYKIIKKNNEKLFYYII